MSTKRKRGVIIVFLIITFVVLGWQVFRLIETDIGMSAKAKPASNKNKMIRHRQAKAPKLAKWDPTTKISATEKRYLHLASEIQEAKMHHQLLQQQVAIAEAEKKLALSHQQAVNISPSGTQEIGDWSKSSNTNHSLHLVYLAKVASGHWEATLQKGSELVHVGRGTDLGEGLHVAAIIEQGLWLQDAQGVRWLGFPGESAPSGAAAASVQFVQHERREQAKRHKRVVRKKVVKKKKMPVKLALSKPVKPVKPVKHVVLNLPHWLQPQSLHVLPASKKPQVLVKKKRHYLSSDEMLFLEQPGEGVTLLAPIHKHNPVWLKLLANDQQIKSTFRINIEGKDLLAVGLFKTASTARIKALRFRDQMPGIHIVPVSIELLQQSILHGSSRST